MHFFRFIYLNRANCTASIPADSPFIWPLFSFIGNLFSQSFTTRASTDEEEVSLTQILDKLEKTSRSSSEILDEYIDKLCRSGNIFSASQLLQSLHHRQIFLSPKSYNILLLAASESGDIDFLCRVFKDFLIFCKSLSTNTFMNLAKAFTRANDCDQLLGFVKEVSELTFPSSTVLNRIIFAFGECREIDKALQIFNQMKSLDSKPDLITYNIILDMLGRAGHVDEMLHEFASMKEVGIIPDVVTYNTLLNNLRKVGRLDICLVYYREMVEKGIEPDLLTYTALIESFGRSGNIEISLRLFREMKLKQIRPSIYVYRSLSNNLKKIGKVELAMTLLEEMNSCGSNLAGPKDFKWRKRSDR